MGGSPIHQRRRGFVFRGSEVAPAMAGLEGALRDWRGLEGAVLRGMMCCWGQPWQEVAGWGR
jgi:hypothetical protein